MDFVPFHKNKTNNIPDHGGADRGAHNRMHELNTTPFSLVKRFKAVPETIQLPDIQQGLEAARQKSYENATVNQLLDLCSNALT